MAVKCGENERKRVGGTSNWFLQPVSYEIRRRPTLPGTPVPSTIGAERLNYRVRDGNGCDPLAKTTETKIFEKLIASTNNHVEQLKPSAD